LIFTKNILLGKPIEIYGYGNMERDFTYVADVIDGTISAIQKSFNKHEIFNLGGDKPVKLNYFVSLLEEYCGKRAQKILRPIQLGDMPRTHADLTKSRAVLNYRPKTRIEEGLKKFVDWFIENKDWTLKI